MLLYAFQLVWVLVFTHASWGIIQLRIFKSWIVPSNQVKKEAFHCTLPDQQSFGQIRVNLGSVVTLSNNRETLDSVSMVKASQRKGGTAYSQTSQGAFPPARQRLIASNCRPTVIGHFREGDLCKCVSLLGCSWKASVFVVCFPPSVCVCLSCVLHSSTLSPLLPGSCNCSDKVHDSWQLPGKHALCLFEISH